MNQILRCYGKGNDMQGAALRPIEVVVDVYVSNTCLLGNLAHL